MNDEAINRVQSLVAERVTRTICPFCGEDHWVVVEGLTGVGVYEFDATEARRDERQGLPEGQRGINTRRMASVAWICWNCGFLRVHVVAADVFEAV